MRLTNERGLPQAIVEAIANDDYHRGECDMSVTQLIGPPRLVELRRQHEDEIVEDAADRIWLLMGKVAHGILEKAAPSGAALTEERLFIDVDTKDTEADLNGDERRVTWRVSGAFDTLALAEAESDTWKLSDYKVTSVWAAKNGANKAEWVQQLNCYALMLREHSFHVSELEIVAICRDWRVADARRYAMDGYPQHQVEVIRLPLWASNETRRFMEERVALHRAARVELPLCNEDERWKKRDVYAVMKSGRKSAVRLFPSLRDAELARDLCAIEARGKAEFSIKKRPGLATRCNDYCAVLDFCKARDDGQFQDGDLALEQPPLLDSEGG